jgi:murein DD-endopeptidase MepM/ murein hydrolase activator NlpD
MSDAPTKRSQGYGNIYTPHAGSMIIQVQRESGLANRTIVLTMRQVKFLRIGLYVAAIVIGLGALSWFFLAAQAARVPFLSRKVVTLQHDARRLDTLQLALTEMERRYQQVQQMMGVVPSPAGSSTAEFLLPNADTAAPTLPSEWPLPVKGYITRGNGGATAYNAPHPGVDVAVPIGTQVRASGAGTVVEVKNDDEYGKFVRIAHPDTYESVYAHLSEVYPKQGDRVAKGQVIALSGNSGRSTAPHLHFEVRRGGVAVDPLQLIKRGP